MMTGFVISKTRKIQRLLKTLLVLFQRPLRDQIDNGYHVTSVAFNLNLKITFP